MELDVIKIMIASALAFFVGIGITPTFTDFLYKNKMWKKKVKNVAVDGRGTPIFSALHKDKEINTPRMGGVIVWVSTLIVMVGIWLLAKFSGFPIFEKLDFLSRDQTWIPLATLLIGALIGLIDDVLEVQGGGGHIAGGLSLRKRLIVVALVSIAVSLWFYMKLDVSTVSFFFFDPIFLGWMIIPFFTLMVVALYASGTIDGLDGLAGGVFATIFVSYAVVAFSNGQLNLAAFCATIAGALLAFLWYNVPPARFYMTETGTMGLTITLGVVAFMTDTLGEGIGVSVLPIIAFPLVATVITTAIQVGSKKFRDGKKVFLVAPIHHHFEALGWPSYKVTMRYWILSVIFAVVGLLIALSA